MSARLVRRALFAALLTIFTLGVVSLGAGAASAQVPGLPVPVPTPPLPVPGGLPDPGSLPVPTPPLPVPGGLPTPDLPVPEGLVDVSPDTGITVCGIAVGLSGSATGACPEGGGDEGTAGGGGGSAVDVAPDTDLTVCGISVGALLGSGTGACPEAAAGSGGSGGAGGGAGGGGSSLVDVDPETDVTLCGISVGALLGTSTGACPQAATPTAPTTPTEPGGPGGPGGPGIDIPQGGFPGDPVPGGPGVPEVPTLTPAAFPTPVSATGGAGAGAEGTLPLTGFTQDLLVVAGLAAFAVGAGLLTARRLPVT